jgi:hypothetical protein
MAQESLVGETAVDENAQVALGLAGIEAERLPQRAHVLGAIERHAGGFAGQAIGFLVVLGGVLARFGGRGDVGEIDGDGAGGTRCVAGRKGGRELQDSLGAHEVGLEFRAEGIATPGDARDFGAGLGQQRVIHGHAQGPIRRQLSEQVATDDGESGGGVEALLGEQAVGGRPVLELPAAGAQECGHGVASEAEQRTQREHFGESGDALVREVGGALLPQSLDLFEESEGSFFFSTGGGALGRWRASKSLCSTNHSTTSPRENSMAWARAEGKLIYHC